MSVARISLMEPTEADSQARRGGRAGIVLSLALAGLVVAAIEVFLLQAYLTDRIGWQVVAASHFGLVVGLACWAYWSCHRGGDCSLPLLVTVSVAAAGPVGALAGVAAIMLARRRQDDHKLLDEWYQRIAMAVETDDVTRLCEQVMSGRTSDLTERAPPSFAAIMERGSLNDRQAALGIIARNFHPDYLPVLMMALKSPEPVIRVQAAAVATRVRGDLRALVDRHALSDALSDVDGIGALAAADQLDAAVASGLLDEGDRIRAGAIAQRLRSIPTGNSVPMRLQPLPVLQRAAAETELLREGRFVELRVSRRIAALADAGRYRVRRARRLTALEAR